MLIGKIPGKEDIDNLITQAKQVGEDKLKQVEQTAAKILEQVNKAKKDGKGQADAFLKGLKGGESCLYISKPPNTLINSSQPLLRMWTI